MDIGPKERRKNNAVRRGERGTRPYLLRILLCRIRDRDELRNQLALRRCGRHPRNLDGRPPAEFVSPKMQRCAGKARSRRAEQTPDDGRQSGRLGFSSSPTRPQPAQPWVQKSHATDDLLRLITAAAKYCWNLGLVGSWLVSATHTLGPRFFSQRKESRQRGRGRGRGGGCFSLSRCFFVCCSAGKWGAVR